MTALRFVGDDFRWLLETLVDACETTHREGQIPAVIVNGRKLDLHAVAAMLPNEELQPHHLTAMRCLRVREQGYRRVGLALAFRAQSIQIASQIIAQGGGQKRSAGGPRARR
jgi:hypothetical protein